jgi:hypothetical protein
MTLGWPRFMERKSRGAAQRLVLIVAVGMKDLRSTPGLALLKKMQSLTFAPRITQSIIPLNNEHFLFER